MKTRLTSLSALSGLAVWLGCVLSAVGPQAHAQGQPASAPASASAASQAEAMTNGEVRQINLDAKKITLRHEAIEPLGMPAMTMVFRVADAALLDQLQPGEKVRFRAERQGGALVVTAIEPVP